MRDLARRRPGAFLIGALFFAAGAFFATSAFFTGALFFTSADAFFSSSLLFRSDVFSLAFICDFGLESLSSSSSIVAFLKITFEAA